MLYHCTIKTILQLLANFDVSNPKLLRRVSGFLRVVWFHLPIKLTSTIAEIVLKVALSTTTLILLMYITLQQTYEDTEWAIKNSKSMNTLCNGQYDKQ